MENAVRNFKLISSVFILLCLSNCQVDEVVVKEVTNENSISKATQIKYISLDIIPDIKNELEEIKRIKKGKSNNKTITDFGVDENKIIELIKENGDRNYSFIIENSLNEKEAYTVENLNIMVKYETYEAFITKWIPSDGKPFYDVNTFVGKLQYTDLDGNLLYDLELGKSTNAKIYTVGCVSIDVQSCACEAGFSIVSVSDRCGMYGGGTTSGGGTTIGSGSTGTTTGSGSGSSTSSGTTTFVPNIPTQDAVEKKLYNTFLVSLNKNQYNFLGYYQDINLEIFNYLHENEFTYANKTAAKELINILMNNSDASFAYRIITDPSFVNNPCLNGVYTKLGGSTIFQTYLKRFDGEFSVANLKLSAGVDPIHTLASAVTYEPINYLIEIKFNPNFLNSPPLNIARTFFHEMLHAEMFRKLLSLSVGGNITWSADFIKSIKDDYPAIADYYMRYKYNIPAGQQPSNAQHELMAQHSRDIIIQVLKQYDPTQTEELYNALAWIGLMGNGEPNIQTGLPPQPTVAWAKIPQAERLQILAIYRNFINTNPLCQEP